MLNKELLMVTGGKTEWYTKLTVGSANNHYGYSTDKDLMGIFGSMSKEPSWTSKGKACSLWAFTSYKNGTFLFINSAEALKNYFSEITVTVVEKNLTLTFNYFNIFGYDSQTLLFTPDDVGKTFTIGFDPPPDSYA
jgi:hypothetical protein